jgi:AcrR family transcriptional regulator
MGRDASETRERLLRAGERLFAQHGIDAVRVREINQLAGQRNSSALHYHFGSREGLLAAIRERHRGPIEDRRIAMLDALEADGRTDDLRALVETIVVPFAAELATESGRDYLRILPQVTGRLGLPVGRLPDAFGPDGIRRSLRYAHRCLADLPLILREERLAVMIEFMMYAVSRRAQEIDLGGPFRLPEEQFVANVVDMAVGALTAPVARSTPVPRPAIR